MNKLEELTVFFLFENGDYNIIYRHRVTTTFTYRNPVIFGTAQTPTLAVTDRFYNICALPVEINMQPVDLWSREINVKAVCYG